MLHDEVQDLWDAFHPSEGEEEVEFAENGDYVDLEDVPQIPTIDLLPECIDYSARAPGDFVISGPKGAGRGPGRHFANQKQAIAWAQAKYGKARVKLIADEMGSEFRWALLVKAVA